MSSKEYGVLMLLGAVWGASFMFIKIAGTELQPFALVEMRLGVAALVLLAVNAPRRGHLAAMRANWRSITVMGFINCAVPYVLITWGETYINSGLAAIYNACAPLWGALLLALLPASSERLNRLRFAGLLCGMAGVVLVVSGNLSLASENPLYIWGQAACILAALAYAVSGIFGKRALVGVPSSVLATGQLVAGALMLLPLAAFQIPSRVPSVAALSSVATLAVAGTALASMMYYWLLKRVGATRVLLVTYLLPAFALGWGALFLHEPVTIAAVVGLALVLAGVAITSSSGLPTLFARFHRAGRSGGGTGDLPV